MPVHAVAGGYRWGKTGKVYRSRAAAERQARAIYASGWRDDSRALHRVATRGTGPRARLARRKLAKLLRASHRAEFGYLQALRRIFAAMHRAVLAHVEPRIEQPEQRRDDEKDDPIDPDWERRLIAIVTHKVAPAFDDMAASLDKNQRRGLQAIGVSPDEGDFLAIVSASRELNIRLVENAGRAYADDVRDIFGDPDNFGLRPEALRDKLLERGNVSLSRASLIARDQTLKTNAAITEARHRTAGITKYIWSTSHDERVRESHDELDGETFSYDDPPETNEAGDTNNPGEDYQCRCCAIPVFEEEEAEGDDVTEAPGPDVGMAAEE